MAWETPDTFVDGENVPTAKMTRISTNLSALKAPPADQAILDDVANYTKSGTAWADIDASFNVQVVTTGGAVEVSMHLAASNNNAAAIMYFDLDHDTNGTAQGRIGTDDGITFQTQISANAAHAISFSRRITGLAAGTHVFQPQVKQSAGTTTIYTGPTASAAVHGQLWAAEIS